MIRLHIIAEGNTEESFVKTLLIEHLGYCNLSTDVRLVNIGKTFKRKRKDRGGILNYEDVKKDIGRWLKEDLNTDVRFTTMFDLYALPSNFPGYDEAKKCSDIYERVQKLEQSFQEDIGDRRFLPYIQLHEFETLLLSDPAKFSEYYAEDTEAIQELIAICSKFSSPEAINDGKETAPSKRIQQKILGYNKVAAGTIIAQKIGLETIRSKCPHFNSWLNQLESLHPNI